MGARGELDVEVHRAPAGAQLDEPVPVEAGDVPAAGGLADHRRGEGPPVGVVHNALRAGASGFLVKDMALDDITTAVRVVADGDALLAPKVTRRLIEEFTARPRPAAARPPQDLRGITDREREVLTLIGRGLSNAEIAEALFITAATVKAYVTRLLAKLDARDRVHLVITAYEHGLVSAGRR
nr:response regulator transcription factor [Kitasatospora setae]